MHRVAHASYIAALILLGLTASTAKASDDQAFTLTLSRECTSPEWADCTEIPAPSNADLNVNARVGDGFLKLAGQSPIYVQLGTVDGDKLEITYAGKDKSGIRHAVTYGATGVFTYEITTKDGAVTYFKGPLEKRK